MKETAESTSVISSNLIKYHPRSDRIPLVKNQNVDNSVKKNKQIILSNIKRYDNKITLYILCI